MKKLLLISFMMIGRAAWAQEAMTQPAPSPMTEEADDNFDAGMDEPTTQEAETMPTTRPTTMSSGTATTKPSYSRSNSSRTSSRYSSDRSDRSDRSSRRSSSSGYSRDRGSSSTQPAHGIGADYQALLSRSIFMRGRQHVNEVSNPTTAPTAQYASPVVIAPERSLLFNGVTAVDDHFDAIIENLSTRTITTVHLGDAIASGKIAAINLDELVYQVGDKIAVIGIGEALDGSSPALDSLGSTSGTSSPTTSNSGSSSGSGSSGTTAEQMLERLKQRRLRGE